MHRNFISFHRCRSRQFSGVIRRDYNCSIHFIRPHISVIPCSVIMISMTSKYIDPGSMADCSQGHWKFINFRAFLFVHTRKQANQQAMYLFRSALFTSILVVPLMFPIDTCFIQQYFLFVQTFEANVSRYIDMLRGYLLIIFFFLSVCLFSSSSVDI